MDTQGLGVETGELEQGLLRTSARHSGGWAFSGGKGLCRWRAGIARRQVVLAKAAELMHKRLCPCHLWDTEMSLWTLPRAWLYSQVHVRELWLLNKEQCFIQFLKISAPFLAEEPSRACRPLGAGNFPPPGGHLALLHPTFFLQYLNWKLSLASGLGSWKIQTKLVGCGEGGGWGAQVCWGRRAHVSWWIS